MEPKDLKDLKKAKSLLEKDSFAIDMANLFGDALEKTARLLPPDYRRYLEIYTVAAIGRSWEFSMTTMADQGVPPEHERTHMLYVTISGAVGGVGIVTLLAELPVTTVIMLRAIADIAKDEGEDHASFETRLACMEVFAFGGNARNEDTGETGYYATRDALKKPLDESSQYIAKKGLAGIGAPFIVQFVAKVAARYQTVVSTKVAATAVPLAGAIAGALINILFIKYFQDKARGHFIVRRLERKYGAGAVKQTYKAISENRVSTKYEKDAIET